MSVVNQLTSQQEQCLNRVIHLIDRGEWSSARQVLQLPNNGLGKELSKKILTNISSNPDEIAKRIGESRTEKRSYSILLNPPVKEPVLAKIALLNSESPSFFDELFDSFFGELFDFLKEIAKEKPREEIIKQIEESRSEKTPAKEPESLPLFTMLPYEIWAHIIDFCVGPNDKDVLILRLVSHPFSQAMLLSPIWLRRFWQIRPDPLKGFEGRTKNRDLYFQWVEIEKNIKQRRGRYDNLVSDNNYPSYADMHAYENQLAILDGRDNTIKIWDRNERKQAKTIKTWPHWLEGQGHVKMIDQHVYLASAQTVAVWKLDLPDSQPAAKESAIQTMPLQQDIHHFEFGNIEVDSNYLYTLTVPQLSTNYLRDRIVNIWDRNTGQSLREINVYKTDHRRVLRKFFVSNDSIFGLCDAGVYVWDNRTANLVTDAAQNKKEFHSMAKGDRELYLGTLMGGIYSFDFRATNFLYKCTTTYPISIEHLVSDGNYFFASCATSSDIKEINDYKTIEILNKEGKSLKILEKTTPTSNRIFGFREEIRKIQMHQGVLYTNSRYTGGTPGLGVLGPLEPTKRSIKTWDFN